MTWQNEMSLLVRWMVDDLECDLYSDSTIEQGILVGAQFVTMDAEFTVTYTIDADSFILSPDPTTASPKDNDFINLVTLKTSCILLKGELKSKGAQAVRIIDGPSQIDARQLITAVQKVYEDVCGQYEKALLKFQITGGINGAGSPGAAITTPITVEGLSPNHFRYY